jgi:hypothetical protein
MRVDPGVRRSVLSAALFLLLAPPAPAHADELITLRAEVVDPSGYLREGRQGPATADLTYEAAEGGQSLALLDPATGTLYLLLTEETGEDPNELVYEYANQVVNVTGRVYQRGGVKGIVLSSVEPVRSAMDAEPGLPAVSGHEPVPEVR